MRRQRSKEEEAGDLAEEEEESGGVTASLNNLSIETAETEEEGEEHLETALGREVKADDGSKGKEGGDGTLTALGALEFLTQEADPSGTMLVDACNGFNKLSRLAMLWTVRHL